jgi:hypothetical protein
MTASSTVARGCLAEAAGDSVVLASVELAFAFSKPGHVENSILMGAIAFAVAALGPGFLSIDAELCGRKLIVIRDE